MENTEKNKLFNNFTRNFIQTKFSEYDMQNCEIEFLEDKVLDIYMNTLILLINEKRLLGILKGSTSEERYEYFNDVLCGKYIIDEISKRFPKLVSRSLTQLKNYLLLYRRVEQLFLKDVPKLIQNRFISNQCENFKMEDLQITVSGDFHNGSGVCILFYKGERVIYKGKKNFANQLLIEIFSKLGDEFEESLEFLPRYIDCGDYYWEEYIEHTSIRNSNISASEYYKRFGYLLAVAYLLNISDLHFENILASGDIPKLVDVETIFNLQPYEIISETIADKDLLKRNAESVLLTGLLPLAGSNEVFGGDTSGILGGKFVGEVRVIQNQMRDDISVKRQVVRKTNKSHLPFYISEGEEQYFEVKYYLRELLFGFKKVTSCFENKKNTFLSIIEKYSEKIDVRILFRNTKDYSIVRTLLLSPKYSENDNIIFEKFKNKLVNYQSDELCESEIKQLEQMDIPYFSMKSNSCDVYDLYGNAVWSTYYSPIELIRKKIQNLSVHIIEEQCKLIEFSISSTLRLYNQEALPRINDVEDKSYSDSILYKGVQNIVDRLLGAIYLSNSDQTCNWLTLSINNVDCLELSPMDCTLYGGLSGVALALIESMTLLEEDYRKKVRSVLPYLYNSILKKYEHLTNDSFYLGRMGVLYTLKKLSKEVGKDLDNWVNIEIDNVISRLNIGDTDFLTGISSVIPAIRLENLNKVTFEELSDIYIKQAKEKDNFVFWGNEQSNNVSLAHGNLGIELVLVRLIKVLDNSNNKETISTLLKKAINFDNLQRREHGWVDNRNFSHSANWCHGATGVLLSRIDLYNQLKNDKTASISSTDLQQDVIHSLQDIKEVGLNLANFSLCHGVSGNLLTLVHTQNFFDENNIVNNYNLKKFVRENFYKIHLYGLQNGWMCNFNTKYDSYALFTGLSGILYATTLYLKNDIKSDVLLPNIIS